MSFYLVKGGKCKKEGKGKRPRTLKRSTFCNEGCFAIASQMDLINSGERRAFLFWKEALELNVRSIYIVLPRS